MLNQQKIKTKNWREWLLTPLIEFGLLFTSYILTTRLMAQKEMGVFLGILIFYLLLLFLTIVMLTLIRILFTFRRGIYSYQNNPWIFYTWRLHEFLSATNLNFFYLNSLLPPVFRKYFYWLLGASFKGGFTSIGGRILSPYMVQIGSNVRIGDEVLLMPYTYSIGSTDLLVLDQINIGDGVVIEPRATIMPGVVIGQNSMVQAMSVVTMNTKIPPNEVWGGLPAKKVADVDSGNLTDSNPGD